MTRIDTVDDYDEFVEMLASRGNVMSESPKFVANHAIIDTANVGDVKTLRFSLEPFARRPAEQTRIWPKDVLECSDMNWKPEEPDELRALAVEILTRDIARSMEEQQRG